MAHPQSAASRLLLVHPRYEEADDDDLGIKGTRTAAVKMLLDLNTVVAVREIPDYDEGTGKAGYCAALTHDRWWSVKDPFATVSAAWATYVAHASAPFTTTN